jgi:hypothetical protein
LDAQKRAFVECGWRAIDLSNECAAYYGVSGKVANHVLFVRNLRGPLGDRRDLGE